VRATGGCPREGRAPFRAPRRSNIGMSTRVGSLELANDPSAGSPTETLLRLLLPLDDRVWITSQL
jgi:hypothetical protein